MKTPFNSEHKVPNDISHITLTGVIKDYSVKTIIKKTDNTEMQIATIILEVGQKNKIHDLPVVVYNKALIASFENYSPINKRVVISGSLSLRTYDPGNGTLPKTIKEVEVGEKDRVVFMGKKYTDPDHQHNSFKNDKTNTNISNSTRDNAFDGLDFDDATEEQL
jgi:hypothetical protein